MDFSRLRSALAERLKSQVVNIRVRGGNTLYFQIDRGDVVALARFLRSDFRAELMLMVANDRRADKGAFEALPTRFRFKDVRQSMGGRSDSNADRLLKKCMSLEIVRKEGNEYVKTAHVPTLERMECVESVQ